MSTHDFEPAIERAPDIAGGKPRIAGHRITVQDVALWYEWLGRPIEEIATEHDLTLAEIHAALAYYYAHQKEIDRSIRESADFVAALRVRIPSKLVKEAA